MDLIMLIKVGVELKKVHMVSLIGESECRDSAPLPSTPLRPPPPLSCPAIV